MTRLLKSNSPIKLWPTAYVVWNKVHLGWLNVWIEWGTSLSHLDDLASFKWYDFFRGSFLARFLYYFFNESIDKRFPAGPFHYDVSFIMSEWKKRNLYPYLRLKNHQAEMIQFAIIANLGSIKKVIIEIWKDIEPKCPPAWNDAIDKYKESRERFEREEALLQKGQAKITKNKS